MFNEKNQPRVNFSINRWLDHGAELLKQGYYKSIKWFQAMRIYGKKRLNRHGRPKWQLEYENGRRVLKQRDSNLKNIYIYILVGRSKKYEVTQVFGFLIGIV